MSDDERAQPGQEAHDEAAPTQSDVQDDALGPQDAEEPQITLDHYYSRRRPPIKSGWTHIVSLIAMLAALVMIMIYKDRCGQQVSELMGTMGPADAGGAPATYQLPEGQKPSK